MKITRSAFKLLVSMGLGTLSDPFSKTYPIREVILSPAGLRVIDAAEDIAVRCRARMVSARHVREAANAQS